MGHGHVFLAPQQLSIAMPTPVTPSRRAIRTRWPLAAALACAVIGLTVALPGRAQPAMIFQDSFEIPEGVLIPSPLEAGVGYSLYDASRFIYVGPGAVQTDIDPALIEPLKVSVIRGRVTSRAGDPLEGIEVSIRGRSEFGRTESRENGEFDLVVNGGETLTVQLRDQDFLPLQRALDTQWEQYALLPDVVLTPLADQVDVIALGPATGMQMAAGPVSTDDSGARQPVMLFPAGVGGEMVMADGSRQQLSSISVRATEYTVGDAGPAAMPGSLPPTSDYTYAVELSADEAFAAGATSVEFDQPVAFYLENYLNFSPGMAVPAGYYDAERGLWIPSDDGAVVEIIDFDQGLAGLDFDGDGLADDQATLDLIGVTTDERLFLAGRYQIGDTLWRVPIAHFTPWDLNQVENREDAQPMPDPVRRRPRQRNVDSPCPVEGSVIECQNRVLGQVVPIQGTDLTLNYRSDRVPGRVEGRTIEIDLGGPDAAVTTEIELSINVAGQRFEQTFPSSGGTFSYTWDGRDGYGRIVDGVVLAQVDLEYKSLVSYCVPPFTPGGRSFGGIFASINCSNSDPVLFERTDRRGRRVSLFALDYRQSGIGSWSFDVHHRYDPKNQVLYFGDGREKTNPDFSQTVVRTAAGGGSSMDDGISALQADFLAQNGQLQGLTVGPQGQFVVSLGGQQLIREIDPEGFVRTLAGTAGAAGFAGDGGPAIDALLNDPTNVAFGPNQDLYFIDRGNDRIRRIDNEGIITTVVGGGVQTPADGVSGLEASLSGLQALEIGPDGGVYFSVTGGAPGIWAMLADGRLQNVLADTAALSIGFDPRGSLYVADQFSRLTEIVPGARIDYFFQDGAPGRKGFSFFRPTSLAFREDASLLVADPGLCLWQVPPPSTLAPRPLNGQPRQTVFVPLQPQVIAGDRLSFNICNTDTASTLEPNSTNALNTRFGGAIADIAVAPDGSVLLADAALGRVRRLSGAVLPSSDDILIADENQPWVYRFDRRGRHLDTLHQLTGEAVWSFQYTSDGKLAGLTDGYGRQAMVQRDAAGEPAALIAPDGQRTTLELDDNGYLSAITNAAGDAARAVYDELGLMTRWTTPRGDATDYQFDPAGLLSSFTASDGYGLSFATTFSDDAFTVTTTAASGASSTTEVALDNQRNRVLTNTNRDGMEVRITEDRDNSVEIRYGSGRIERSAIDTQERLGSQVPVNEVLMQQQPGGPSFMVTTQRSFSEDPNNPIQLTSLTQTRSIGDRTTTINYDVTERALTLSSPLGQARTTTIDGQGKVVRQSYDENLDPLLFSYDSDGRLVERSVGTQRLTYAYDGLGRVTSQTDAAGRQQSFTFDAADRVTSLTSPGGRLYQFAYDANGNVTGVTMPNGQTHQMAYSSSDRPVSYQPPGASPVMQSYNVDRQRTQVTGAAGAVQSFTLSPGGRAQQVTYPEATVDFTYRNATTLLETATWTASADNRSHVNQYTYVGDLPTSVQTGTDTFQYRYDDDLRLAGITLNAQPEVSLVHNDDDRVVGYGPFAIERAGPAGLASQYTAGNSVVDFTFDSQGRVSRRTHRINGAIVYDLTLTHNALTGRLENRMETVGADVRNYAYEYSADGELTAVELNGASLESFAYDVNGNRTGNSGVAASYNVRDELINAGGVVYGYDADGRVVSRSGDTFSYSARGELLQVTLDGGSSVTYSYDAMGRRVARTTASGTSEYLYGDPNQPFNVTAYRDEAGQLSEYFYDEADLLIGIRQGANMLHVASDQVGSPRVIADDSGNVVREIRYSAFGEVLSDSNPAFDLALGFAGGIADPLTGLVRFGFRDYEPATGRWTARDPLLFGGGQFNLYAYANANPLEFRDPSGLFCIGYSTYAGYGAGVKACFKDGSWSICFEVGLGIGGGVDFELGGKPSASYADQDYNTVGGAVACGPLQFGPEAKLDNCGIFKADFSCRLRPVDACKGVIDPAKGSVKADDAQAIVNGKLKCRVEAAIKGGGCINATSF